MAAILQPLRDRVSPGVRVLLVGINPGIRSASIGHHFAGSSNRFWKLLHESGLVPEAVGAEDDVRLPEWGLGITNLIGRPTPGIDTLRRAEYLAGVGALRRKVRRWKPRVVAFVGVSLYRAIFAKKGPIALGLQDDAFEGARVCVLPNPSGRNANFSYAEMLGAFRALAVVAEGTTFLPRRPRSPRRQASAAGGCGRSRPISR
jgi:TDG/mug DNA glycosylase family protein